MLSAGLKAVIRSKAGRYIVVDPGTIDREKTFRLLPPCYVSFI